MKVINPNSGQSIAVTTPQEVLAWMLQGWAPTAVSDERRLARISIRGDVTLNPNAPPQPGFPALRAATMDDIWLDDVLLADLFKVALFPPAVPPAAAPVGEVVKVADVIGLRAIRVTGNGGQFRETKSYLEFGRWFSEGWRPVRLDGSLMRVDMFMGGELFDGHPSNVLFGLGWLPGQQEAIASAVLSGQIPTPTIDLVKVYHPGGATSSTSKWIAAGVLGLIGLKAIRR